MAFVRSKLAVVIVVLFAALGASAQKNELAGLLGRTFVSDQGVAATGTNIHFGKGLTFEVNYGRRVLGGDFAALTLELPAVFNPDEDLNFIQNSIPSSYSSYFVTPAARLNVFAKSGVSPWVSFGGGFGHFSNSPSLVFGGSNPGSGGNTVGVLQIGAGLDIKLLSHLSLRGELRDFYSGIPQLNVDTGRSRQHNYFVSAGAVFRF
jgi:hypothetical protein